MSYIALRIYQVFWCMLILTKFFGINLIMENNFAKNLKIFRKSFKFSQAELGKQLNVDQRTISAWENGVCEPSFSCLIDLCRIFNETPDSMIVQ